MPAPLHALLYRSTATRPMEPNEYLPLLTQSMRWNALRGITGRLFLTEADVVPVEFVQWIEGDPAEVGVLFERIRTDPRHTDLRVFASGPIADLTGRPGRLYPDWSMSLERRPDLAESLSDFLSAYEGRPERRLLPRWGVAA